MNEILETTEPEKTEVLEPPVLAPAQTGASGGKSAAKLWLIGGGFVFVVVGAAALAFLLYPSNEKPTPNDTGSASTKSFTELHELGIIEALKEIPVVGRFGGEILWLIDEGTVVE